MSKNQHCSISSTFQNLVFKPKIFLTQICEEHPNYLCIVKVKKWNREDKVVIKKAIFYHYKDEHEIEIEIAKILKSFSFPVFDRNDHYLYDDLIPKYQFLNLTPNIEVLIENIMKKKIKEIKDGFMCFNHI